MNERPLHAVLLSGVADAARLIEPLAAALAGSGPAIAPLDAGLPAARLRQLLDAFRPEVVVGPDGDATARSGGERTAADTAVIIGTSGSTGDPKGVELSAAALLHSARASLARLRALPGQRWLCCLPVTYVAGLQVLVRSQVCGTAPALVPALGAQALAAAGSSSSRASWVGTIDTCDAPDAARACAPSAGTVTGSVPQTCDRTRTCSPAT